jgi:hypothetical protein
MHRQRQSPIPTIPRCLRAIALGGLLTGCALGSAGCQLLSDRIGGATGAIQLFGAGAAGGHPQESLRGQRHVSGLHPDGRVFSIAGSLTGLYPGGVEPLVLSVTNTHGYPIVVTALFTRVGDATPLCGPANVRVSEFNGHLRIPPMEAARATVWVTMDHSAPNACQGAVFPFAYRGIARQP